MQGVIDFNKSSKFVFDKDEEGYVKRLKKLHGRKSSSATGMRKHKKCN